MPRNYDSDCDLNEWMESGCYLGEYDDESDDDFEDDPHTFNYPAFSDYGM